MTSIQKLLFYVLLLTSTVGAEEPQRLADLRKSYDKEGQALKQKYIEALNKLKSDYVKGGDKKAVSAILNEIDKVGGNADSGKRSLTAGKVTFLKWLNMVSFKAEDGTVYTVTDKYIEADESAKGKGVFNYSLSGIDEKRRTFTLRYSKEFFFTLRVKSSLKSAEKYDQNGKTNEEWLVISRRKSK